MIARHLETGGVLPLLGSIHEKGRFSETEHHAGIVFRIDWRIVANSGVSF
jgi:hypothetical protein